MRVIDAEGNNIGVMQLQEAIDRARAENLDCVEVATGANPPVVRIISFDKFRYQKEKEEKKQRLAEKAKGLKQVRITPRAAMNDLRIKAKRADEFLEQGYKVEINLFLRGREKGNREWGLKKLGEFLGYIVTPFQKSGEPKWGGRGFNIQIGKK